MHYKNKPEFSSLLNEYFVNWRSAMENLHSLKLAYSYNNKTTQKIFHAALRILWH